MLCNIQKYLFQIKKKTTRFELRGEFVKHIKFFKIHCISITMYCIFEDIRGGFRI